MSCNYCWNQPKKYERYDLYLDGKIKADDFVYRTKDESGEISTTTLSEKIDEIESRLQTHFTFKTVPELPEVGDETVIYLVSNEANSGDKDSYNEYMWVKKEEKFELIGSGSYAQQQADLKAESNRAKEVENELDTRIKAFEEGEGGRIEEKLDQEIEDRIVSESAIANVINDIDLKIQEEKNRAETVESTISVVILELQDKINQLEATIKQLKYHHDVEAPTE